MKSLIALGFMVVWSAVIAAILNLAGFADNYHEPLWSLGAAIILFVGLVGNVWIFLAVVKEQPWEWFKGESEKSE